MSYNETHTQSQLHGHAHGHTDVQPCFPHHHAACVVVFQLSPPPTYIEERLSLYTTLKAEHDALQAQRAESDSKPIKVTLPDGKVVDGESWKTTPYQVAAGIRSVWDMFCKFEPYSLLFFLHGSPSIT